MELTFAQANEAILQRWKVEWPLVHPEIPSDLPNEHFVEPEPWTGDGTDTSPIVPSFWCRVSLQLLPSGQYTLAPKGQRLYRRLGFIWVQFFGPENNGTNGLIQLIDDANRIFEGESFSGIDPSGAANPQEVGGDGKWYQYSVTYPVAFYEKK